jgi:hypothetical protein
MKNKTAILEWSIYAVLVTLSLALLGLTLLLPEETVSANPVYQKF